MSALFVQKSCSVLDPRIAIKALSQLARYSHLQTHLSALRDNPDSIERTPQDDEHATLAPKLTPADSRVDWQASPDEIVDQIRALSERQPVAAYLAPASGAPVRVRILAASTVPQTVPQEAQATAGSILASSRKTLWVACSTGAILRPSPLTC